MFETRVAGVASLLIAKAHKLGERYETGRQERLIGKDAGDVLRLMLTSDVRSVANRMTELVANERTRVAAVSGLRHLEQMFGTETRRGVEMAIDALATEIDADRIHLLAPAFVGRLKAQADS